MKKLVFIAVGFLCLDYNKVYSNDIVFKSQEFKKVTFSLKKSASIRFYTNQITEQTKVNVIIDKTSLSKHGISSVGIINMPTEQEIPLEHALNIITEQLSRYNPGKVFWTFNVDGDVLIFGK